VYSESNATIVPCRHSVADVASATPAPAANPQKMAPNFCGALSRVIYILGLSVSLARGQAYVRTRFPPWIPVYPVVNGLRIHHEEARRGSQRSSRQGDKNALERKPAWPLDPSSGPSE
jgi:hypothetical protein